MVCRIEQIQNQCGPSWLCNFCKTWLILWDESSIGWLQVSMRFRDLLSQLKTHHEIILFPLSYFFLLSFDGIFTKILNTRNGAFCSWCHVDVVACHILKPHDSHIPDIIASHCSYIIVRYETSVCWMAKSNKSIISQREWDKKLKIRPQHNIEWMIDSNPQKQNWSSIQTPWRYRIFKLFAGPNNCKCDKIWSCDGVESAVGLSYVILFWYTPWEASPIAISTASNQGH